MLHRPCDATGLRAPVTAGPAASRAVTAPAALPAALWIGVPGAAALALYAPLVPRLVREWIDFPNLSHGFLIPFVAALLVWARRDRLRAVAIRPSLLGLPLLVAGLGALVIGIAGEESFVARLSLPVTALGLVLFLAGTGAARVLWLPIAYLALMIPPPWSTLKLITYRARLLDASAAATALDFLGVPVHRDGVFLRLPTVILEVTDECSSIPAIAAMLALGVAYAALARRPPWVRLALVAAIVPLAIAANIVRITSVAWAAHAIGRWTLATAFHMFNGTVNFLVTLLLLVALDTVLARASRERAP
jgi:exosortase